MFECSGKGPRFRGNFTGFMCLYSGNSTESSGLTSSETFSEIVLVYVIGVLCILGIVGNSLSVTVFRHDRLAREPLFLLSVLAVVDALYLFSCLLRYPIKHAIESWEYIEEYKIVVYPLTYTMQTLAIWTMLPVTFDRYLAACHPFSGRTWCNRRNKLLAMALVILLSVCFNIPRWLESCISTTVNQCTNRTFKYKIFKMEYASRLYFDLYHAGAYLIFVYIFPLASLIGLNIKLIQAIMYSAKRHRSICGRDEQTEENNTTRVLVIVVIEFVICQTPELVRHLLTVLNRHLHFLNGYHNELDHLRVISIFFLVINSSINFIVYVIFGRKFRRQLGDIFLRKRFANKSTILTTNIEQDAGLPLNSKPTAL